MEPYFAADLTDATTKCFQDGNLTLSFKETTTVVPKKRGSYRPIALENSIAKVIENVLVNHLSQLAEENSLQP